MSEEGRSRTRDMLLNVLGGYAAHEQNDFWSGDLVRLLGDLGCTPAGTRMALARLGEAGLIDRRRSGRTTHYLLTPRGRRLLLEGHERIFTFGDRSPWDGVWTVVLYSIPEDMRPVRNRLRTNLRFWGFTNVYQGSWIAARNRVDRAQQVIDELEVGEYTHVFAGRPADEERMADELRKSWDLDTLKSSYIDFIDTYAPYHKKGKRGRRISDRDAFVLRTDIMQSFRKFLLIDPDLPEEVTGEPTQRNAAVELFTNIWNDLQEPAERYVDENTKGPA